METKDLIKELRILEKSSKLGEQACICGEAANRLEELLQEIEISRRLEKSENHKENDDRKQLLSKNKKKMEVKIIQGNKSVLGAFHKKVKKLRVAAYCRVSTDDEDQIKSYNSMIQYYTDLIQKNDEWEFVGIYADKAITGISVKPREDFQRLIEDCMDGKIDMIVTKSIPRFARNTLDTLRYVRLLREKNVAIYFEVEKINTLIDGEFLMTILSSVAQQEVENTSAYVKKGLKMKMKRGELVGFSRCFGYDRDKETGELKIIES